MVLIFKMKKKKRISNLKLHDQLKKGELKMNQYNIVVILLNFAGFCY